MASSPLSLRDDSSSTAALESPQNSYLRKSDFSESDVGSAWLAQFRARLVQAKHAPLDMHPSEVMAEVESRAHAQAKLDPITIAVTVIVVVKLAIKVYTMINGWIDLYNAGIKYKHQAGVVYRDVLCRSGVDSLRSVKLLEQQKSLLLRTTKHALGVDAMEMQENCSPKKDKESGEEHQKRVSACKKAGEAVMQACVKKLSPTVNPNSPIGKALRSKLGNSPEQSCQGLVRHLLHMHDVDALVAAAKGKAEAYCSHGVLDHQCDELKDPTFGTVTPELRECALARARVDFVEAVGTALPAEATQATFVADPGGWITASGKILLDSFAGSKFTAKAVHSIDTLVDDAGKTRQEVGDEAVRKATKDTGTGSVTLTSQEETKIRNDAWDKHKGDWDKKVYDDGEFLISALTISELAIGIIDSAVKLSIGKFVFDNIKTEQHKLVTGVCQATMDQGRTLINVERMLSAQEEMYDILSLLDQELSPAGNSKSTKGADQLPRLSQSTSSDTSLLEAASSPTPVSSIWSEGMILVMRKLYATYRGYQQLGTLVEDDRWIDNRCKQFVQRNFDVDVEQALGFCSDAFPEVMKHVAIMADPTFSDMDAFLVLFDSNADSIRDPPEKRYQRALFNVQRTKLAGAFDRIVTDLRSYGCSSFDTLQLMFERHRTVTGQDDLETGDASKLPVCSVEEAAFCVASYHYARCFAKPHETIGTGDTAITVGGVLERVYKIYRTDHAYASSLPIKEDPYVETIKPMADVVERAVTEFAGNKRTNVVDEFSKVFKEEHFTGDEDVHPHLAAPSRARFDVNVKHVLSVCGNVLSQTPFVRPGTNIPRSCTGSEELADWMGATQGSFRSELAFGGLTWLAAALFAPKSYLKRYFFDANLDFVPLGCEPDKAHAHLPKTELGGIKTSAPVAKQLLVWNAVLQAIPTSSDLFREQKLVVKSYVDRSTSAKKARTKKAILHDLEVWVGAEKGAPAQLALSQKSLQDWINKRDLRILLAKARLGRDIATADATAFVTKDGDDRDSLSKLEKELGYLMEAVEDATSSSEPMQYANVVESVDRLRERFDEKSKAHLAKEPDTDKALVDALHMVYVPLLEVDVDGLMAAVVQLERDAEKARRSQAAAQELRMRTEAAANEAREKEKKAQEEEEKARMAAEAKAEAAKKAKLAKQKQDAAEAAQKARQLLEEAQTHRQRLFAEYQTVLRKVAAAEQVEREKAAQAQKKEAEKKKAADELQLAQAVKHKTSKAGRKPWNYGTKGSGKGAWTASP